MEQIFSKKFNQQQAERELLLDGGLFLNEDKEHARKNRRREYIMSRRRHGRYHRHRVTSFFLRHNIAMRDKFEEEPHFFAKNRNILSGGGRGRREPFDHRRAIKRGRQEAKREVACWLGYDDQLEAIIEFVMEDMVFGDLSFYRDYGC